MSTPPLLLAVLVPALIVIAPLLYRRARLRARRRAAPAARTPSEAPAGPALAVSSRWLARPTHHATPFDAIEVPVNDGPLPWRLASWVDPIYLGLDDPALPAFVRERVDQFTDANLTMMLGHDGWRERVAAARLALIAERRTMGPLLGRLLLRSDAMAAGRDYCLALAAFDAPDGIDCIERYLDYYLGRPDLDYNQDEAIAALAWHDRRHGTDRTSRHVARWRALPGRPRDLARALGLFSAHMEALVALRPPVPQSDPDVTGTSK